MEKKMEATMMGYIGATRSIPSFLAEQRTGSGLGGLVRVKGLGFRVV